MSEGAEEYEKSELGETQADDLATAVGATGLCLRSEEERTRAKPLGCLGSLETRADGFSTENLGLWETADSADSVKDLVQADQHQYLASGEEYAAAVVAVQNMIPVTAPGDRWVALGPPMRHLGADLVEEVWPMLN